MIKNLIDKFNRLITGSMGMTTTNCSNCGRHRIYYKNKLYGSKDGPGEPCIKCGTLVPLKEIRPLK